MRETTTVVVQKLMDEDKKLVLNEVVEMVAWTHNMNAIVSGFTPLQVMTGKSVTYPGISQGNKAMESVFEYEGVRHIMEGHFEVGKKFRELEFWSKD